MARKFSQRHYIEIADVLVEATRRAQSIRENHTDSPNVPFNNSAFGIQLVTEVLVDVFGHDSSRFDIQKFEQHIRAATPKGRAIA